LACMLVKKKTTKKLTLNQAAKKMAAITQKYLEALPQKEKEKRIKAFQSVINGVSSSAGVVLNPADIPSKSIPAHHIQRSRVYARGPGSPSRIAANP